MKNTSKIETNAEPRPAIEWLTRCAFGLSLALVVARATMLEVLSDPLGIVPGADPVPRGPGSSTSLVLDLLAWVPALLVLTRAALNRAFGVRFTPAHLLMFALALWTVLSPLWASDKFSAIVSSFHFLSAVVFLWSTSQLVRSWRRLRVVAGVCVGLLLVCGAQALSYRYIEQPELQKDWEANGAQRMSERGIEAGTFAAKQLEGKILRRETVGFSASANSFAAVAVLLIVITAGVAIQRRADGDGVGRLALPVLGIVVGFAIIVWCDSKTAYATPVLAAAALGAIVLWREKLATRAKSLYFAGVACFVLGVAAIVGHGLRHGSLVVDSMTFRWRYWVGAARIFVAHPILGVGWDNFGLRYLAQRMPIAGEEIRDPHNFVVRFFAELGIVGGTLCVAWMLRLWWELTRPTVTMPAVEPTPRRAMRSLVAVVLGAAILNVLATVDFSFISTGGDAGPAFVTIKLFERACGAAVLLIGMCATILNRLDEPDFDDRPAPLLLYASLVGVGVFLLHNLVDFSLFEIGPMFLFALLAGSCLGMRASSPAAESRRANSIALIMGCAIWLAVAIGIVGPVSIAEQSAAAGDEFLRTRSFDRAAGAYHDASATLPYAADYPYRESKVLRSVGARDRARAALDEAIRRNPAASNYFLARAELAAETSNAGQTRADYDTALSLDPANVDARLDYAGVLAKLGDPAGARKQYETALWFNDQLEPVDAERLPAEKIAAIRAAMAKLGS